MLAREVKTWQKKKKTPTLVGIEALLAAGLRVKHVFEHSEIGLAHTFRGNVPHHCDGLFHIALDNAVTGAELPVAQGQGMG